MTHETLAAEMERAAELHETSAEGGICMKPLTPHDARAWAGQVRDLAGAAEALRIAVVWIERFTSDRGDARMMETGQARSHINRAAAKALGDQPADGGVKATVDA